MQPRSVLAIFSLAALVACDSQRLTGTPIIIGTIDYPTVRLVNAAGGTSGFDLAIGGSVGTSDADILFGEASECRAVTSGSLIAVRAAGGATDLPGFTSPTLVSGARATVLVTGAGDSLRFTTLFDDRNTPAAGRGRIRVFNGTDSSEVDVLLGSAATGTTVAVELGRDEASSFIDLPAGSALLSFVDSDTGAILLDSQPITIVSGQSSTLVLGGPAAGTATLRTFNFAACP